MLAGMFAAKKRAACFNDAAHEQKGVVPAVASRTRFTQLRATDPQPEAKPTLPPTLSGWNLLQAIRNRAAALRGRPVEFSVKLLRIGRRSHRRR